MSESVFSVNKSIGRYARSGLLKTRKGSVKTPVFMPVGTRGAVKSLNPDQVKSSGTQIILTNTYHLHLQPGEKVVSALGGLHRFTGWTGPILTDSGGFQVFSLAHTRKITEEGVSFKDPKTGNKVFITPETSMQIQIELGSDIVMAFDDLTGLDKLDRQRTPEALARTERWLERCVTEFKKLTIDLKQTEKPLLFGISQGGLDKKLRVNSLVFIQSQAVDGVAIGGLSVGESRSEMHKMLKFLVPHYDPAKPRYLMGVGDPVDARFAIEHGIDMMDCVLPTRNARHGMAWVKNSLGKDSKIQLTNAKYIKDSGPIEQGCDCYTCQSGFSRGFLRHQFKSGEPLAGSLTSIHNLRYLHRIFEEYR